MEDHRIIELYWQRSDQAIRESDAKYGRYCSAIAANICGNPQDAEECVSDTWFTAWNQIPPRRPKILSAFFGAITRNSAINRVRSQQREKRGGGQLELALEELQDCIAGPQDVEKAAELRELQEVIRGFVADLKREDRLLFLSRYYFMAPVAEIAEKYGMGESKVKTRLYRLRKKLGKVLQEEGLC